MGLRPNGDIKRPISSTVVLNEGQLAQFLWAAASVTALSHHTTAVKVSPGAILKAAELYNQSLSVLCPAVAIYRQARYGTQDSGSFDMLEVQTSMPAVRTTRDSLYLNMCQNTFMYVSRGPGHLQQYLEHVAVRTHGLSTALDQFFHAIREQNDSVREAIDRMRRRTYAVKISAEVAMVLLGAGPISLGVQVGTGLGYALITTAITSFSDMSKADIIAMPVGRPRPAPETASDVIVSNAASTGMNVVQEGGDHVAEFLNTFRASRDRAIANQLGRIEAKIAEVAAKSGAGRDHVSKAALNTIKDLHGQADVLVARRAAPHIASKAVSKGMEYGTRAAGIGVGIYFLREDIGNVISFIRSGDL